MHPAVGIQKKAGPSPEVIRIPIRVLRQDGETQSRAALNAEVIQEYADLMLEGVELPPVRACFDGINYWITDGFHRIAAAKKNSLDTIAAEIFEGTINEARWDSYGANSVHGLRRTPEDLKHVVSRALCHQTATNMSNCELARHLHVSEKTIRRFRKETSSARAEDERAAVRNGTRYKIRVANIGRARKAASEDRSGEVYASLKRRLAAEILAIEGEASPEARRILMIFRNWTQRSPTPSNVLRALEGVIDEIKPRRFRGGAPGD